MHIYNFVWMIFPKNFEDKIGFTEIRQRLKEKSLFSLGEDYIDRIMFSRDYQQIKHTLSEVDEFKSMLETEDSFPTQDYLNPIPTLKKLKIEGTVIELEQLFDLKISLRTINEIIRFLHQLDKEIYPHLKQLLVDLVSPEEIIIAIDKILSDKGEIKSSASKDLGKIRDQLNKKQFEISGKINRTIQLARKSGWVQEGIEPTIRSGRLVIPVLAANKRKIKGFIHDESATGQTVYIEPAEIFDKNNEIRDLENAEKREIHKILFNLTRFIRQHIDDLIFLYDFLGRIDFIRAKAVFAQSIEAAKPRITNKTSIHWNDAKHPLLYLSHKKQNKKIVPLSLELDTENRILIISGPNAGGKSVCLMTAGLLQYMMQCGLLVPMNEDSEMGIFKKILIDMGDEQSIENDLSTYSSHLLNIKYFIQNAGNQTLFLIDEFGSGTEPQLGGSIAEAVIENLNVKRSFGIITTHYANLKLMADKNSGIINGAMLFDAENLKPLYELKTGKPGSSFTFEIAEQIGFPKKVLNQALIKTGSTHVDFDRQLQQLEVEKNKIEKKKKELKVADDFLAEMIEKYEQLKSDLELTRAEILREAKGKAKQMLADSNKLIENTIREIREIQAEKEKTKELRNKITSQKKEIEKIPPAKHGKKEKAEIKQKKKRKLKKSDFVKLEDQDIVGEIIDISNKNALVSFDTFKMHTPLDKLVYSEKPAKTASKKTSHPTIGNIIDDMNKKMADFKLSIDIRGKHVDEALHILNGYIDDALLLNIPEVRIIHGKGNGILRESVREFLSTADGVRNYHDAHPDRGGHGITVVSFKQ